MTDTTNTSPCISAQQAAEGAQHNALEGRDAANCHPILAITDLQQALDRKLNLTGGTLTGTLILGNETPTNPFEAASKSYVDSIASGGTPDSFVLKAGDIMEGALTLYGEATLPYEAVPLVQMEDAISAQFDTFLVNAPTTNADNTVQAADGVTALTLYPFELNDTPVLNILEGEDGKHIMSVSGAGEMVLGDATASRTEPLITLHAETVVDAPDPVIPMVEAYGWDGERGFTVGGNGDVLVGNLPINEDGTTTGELGIVITKKGTIAIDSASDYPTILIKQTADHTENIMEVYEENEEIGFTINKDAEVIVGGNPLLLETGSILAKNGRVAAYAGSSATSTLQTLLVYRSGGSMGMAVQHDGKFLVSGDASRGYTGFSVDKYGATNIQLSSSGGSEVFHARGWSGSYCDVVIDYKGNVIVGRNPYSSSSYNGVAILGPSGGVRASGNMTASAWTTSSDSRLKQNIHDITDEADKIKKLKPVAFEWKKDNTPTVGLIAQQVQKIYPEAVSEGDDEGHLLVDYNYVFTMLLANTQRLEKRVVELEEWKNDEIYGE